MLRKYEILFVALISFFNIFYRLNEVTLIFDDCYYAQKAKEMVRSHNYLVPTYGYKFNVHDGKPIFYHWVLAFFGSVFGFNNFAMRFGSAMMGFIGVISTLFFVSKYFNSYVGFISALVLTFTQQFLRHSRTAQPDVIFSVFFAFALWSFWMAHQENRPFFYCLMGIFVGFALMTRNIPGLLVYVVIFTYVLLAKETKILKDPHFYLGVLLSLAIFLPWHIWMIIKYKMEFVQPYLGIILRLGFTEKDIYTPWYLIIERILLTYWPWLPFLVIGFYREIKMLTLRKYSNEETKKILFVLSWSFVPFLIFQMAKVKGGQYILPIYMPFAVVVARTFDTFSQSVKKKIIKWVVISLSLLTILHLVFPIAPKTLDHGHYEDIMKLIPTVKKINADIITTNEHFWYFSNGILFYADRRIIGNSEEEILDKINSNGKYFFVLFKDDFGNVTKLLKRHKLNILGFTETVVLFSNK